MESPDFIGQRLQIMFEYFNGRSPNGQFYGEGIKYLGIAAHLYF